VLFVCCVTVVPLPPGENPFAVNNNNNNNNNKMAEISLVCAMREIVGSEEGKGLLSGSLPESSKSETWS
jgi:hypothetical protein